MRSSLFIKIYLWFWIATIFIFMSLMIVERMTESEIRFFPYRMMEDILPPCGLAAVETLKHAGAPALADYALRLEKATGMNVFLYDGDKQLIPGVHGAQDVAEVALLARKSSRVEFVSTEAYNLAAYRIENAEGKSYVFAARMAQRNLPRPPSLPSLLSPFGPPRPPGPPPPRDRDITSGTPPPPMIPQPPPFGFSWLRLSLNLILSGMVCYGLARYVTSPIVMLRGAARRIASGDLSVRVSGSIGRGKDEISGLANDFDMMAERVETLIVSQKKLLRDISHELRSPLARLNVALELCRKKLGQESDAPLARIEHESEKLNELIGELLTLNVLEAGLPKSGDTAIDLGELVGDVCIDAEFEATGQNKTVSAHIGEGFFVRGNGSLLRRGIDNIVRNGIRYTGENSAIEITLSPIERNGSPFALLTVRDHGYGVPEDALPLLFKPFYRVAEDRNRLSGGVGLGLAITEAAVRSHGGDVWAENAPDGGLIIKVVLPVATSGSTHPQGSV